MMKSSLATPFFTRSSPKPIVVKIGDPGDTFYVVLEGEADVWDGSVAQRLRALGVAEVINYKTTPDWDARVRELTHGRGADLVVDVGGPGTLAKSIAAIRYCGHISVVGNLAGKATIDPGTLFAKRASMCGIQVGSRDMFETMNRAIEVSRLQPVIDRVFEFEEARAAYAYLASAQHFGKVVIRLP